MKRWLPHAGIVIGLAIAVYALFFAESEEDRIMAQLEALESAVAVSGDDSPVLRGARVKKAFDALFSKDVAFEIPELVELGGGRNELVRLATAAPQRYQRARVDLGGLRIDLASDKQTAVAHGPAILTAVERNGEPRRDTRTVSLRLDKVEGAWLIVSFSVSEPSSEAP
jgi:hypothetical protein